MIKWTGASLVLISSLLVATNSIYSKYGYITYFVGGLMLLYTAIKEKDKPYIMLNTCFVFTDIIGIVRWLL